jgi:hypothetical protein
VDFEHETLNIELRELGASTLQRQLFEGNVERARAAIAQAYDRGAGNPLSYAISLFRSESFLPERKPKPKPVNTHAPTDPTRTDDGERIWQADEVDAVWRQAYLRDCWQVFSEERDAAAHYQPSDAEFEQVKELHAPRLPISVVNPTELHTNAERALRAWAEVWAVELPERDQDPEPLLELDPEPVLT